MLPPARRVKLLARPGLLSRVLAKVILPVVVARAAVRSTVTLLLKVMSPDVAILPDTSVLRALTVKLASGAA